MRSCRSDTRPHRS